MTRSSTHLALDWRTGSKSQPRLYKQMTTDVVPQLGTDVFFVDTEDWDWGCDPLQVTQVIWWEGSNSFHVVLSEFVDESDNPKASLHKLMEMGWSLIPKKA